MELAAATWTDVAALETDLAVLPVGSTEQHGPHAPLGTDWFTAEAIAEAGIERSDHEVVQAPTVPVGVAAEHRAFAGTMWVRPGTFRAYVRECVESLGHHGFTRVVVVNGHGGNVDALAEVTAAVSRDGDVYTVPFTWFDAIDDLEVSLGHGGPVETALVRELHPALIREDRLEDAADGAADRWGEWVAGVNLAHDADEFTESGVVGDPRAAGEEVGAEVLETAAEALASVIDAVATR